MHTKIYQQMNPRQKIFEEGVCVMSETSKGGSVPKRSDDIVIPDYFGYYTREVADFFSQDDDDSLPCSSKSFEVAGRAHGVVGDNAPTEKYNYKGKDASSCARPLFNDSIKLSDIRKERLKAILRQSVIAFTGEVDELIDPVIAMRRIQYYLKNKTSVLSDLSARQQQPPKKKLKASSSSSSVSFQVDERPTSCSPGAESSGNEDKDVTVLGKRASCSDLGANNVNGEVNEDLKVLLESNGLEVEDSMKKYSDELSTTLCYMEQKVEGLLDIIMSSCRPMTCPEKVQLRRMIQNLPPRNLDRVVELIRCRRKTSEILSSDEIHVDLEDEDDATLWRLYYYAETVQNARKLCVG